MDRIIRSYLDKFSKEFELDKTLKDNTKFEHFCNYTIIEPKIRDSIRLDDLYDIDIGGDGTIGIDGFAIILNNELIETKEELKDFIESNKRINGEVVFLQAKTSTSFNTNEISNFGLSVNDFISESPKYNWSKTANAKIELFNEFVANIASFEEKPLCSLYYICLGTDKSDKNVYAKKDEILPLIRDKQIFSEVSFSIIDNNSIQNQYSKIGRELTKTFDFSSKITLDLIENVDQAYLGMIGGETLIDLMSDDNGGLISSVFYDNVRDYQGDNRVNTQIQNTLSSDYRDSFSILNNGITIVADDIKFVRNSCTIINYQIINGCQTANVLYHNKKLVDDKIHISLKLIGTQNKDVISRVIRSTNSQTEIKEVDLIAFSDFQKNLEKYYNSDTTNDKLYYERRSKQYNFSQIEKSRIISKSLQIKIMGSFFYDKPNLASRYFGKLLAEFKDKIFRDSDILDPYFTTAYLYYKIVCLLNKGIVDTKFRKFKYIILTMFKYEIGKQNYPQFNNKKIEKYCSEILYVVKNEELLSKHVISITKKIESLTDDLTNPELTKSAEFVKKCLDIYRSERK